MAESPRILYGLHESFVLFPYERGGRKIRLVLRRQKLAQLLRQPGLGLRAQMMGRPLVLGEILDCKIQQNVFVPVLCSGKQLNELKSDKVNWAYRHYRLMGFAGGRSLRFEAGTKMIYAAHTAYYAIELLLQLTTETRHEPNPRAGVP